MNFFVQGNLLFNINCGGHVGKVCQSRTKLDNFETKCIFWTFYRNLLRVLGHFEKNLVVFWIIGIFLLVFLPIILLGFWCES